MSCSLKKNRKHWNEDLQKEVYLMCISPRFSVSSHRLPLTKAVHNVAVSDIIECIRNNLIASPHSGALLEDLRKSVIAVSKGGYVNWCTFRKATKLWFAKYKKMQHQDGNNNVHINRTLGGRCLSRLEPDQKQDEPDMYRYTSVWCSDGPVEDPKSEANSVEDHSGSDIVEEDSSTFVMNYDTPVSSYSLGSSMIRGMMTDDTIESSEDLDRNYAGSGSNIELKCRIRKYNEENEILRDDVQRAEEKISSLEHKVGSLQRSLEQVTEKWKQMQKENDEQKEMLIFAERKEAASNQDLRRKEKTLAQLEKKLEEYEKENEQVENLNSRIHKLVQENADYCKQLSQFKKQYDEKCEALETLQDLQKANAEIRLSYETTINYLREKIVELQNNNLELRTKLYNNSSDRLSITPPIGFANTSLHCPPQSSKLQHQDSLYMELKDSGFSQETHVQELRNELSFYDEEIGNFICQIDIALEKLASSKKSEHVPSTQVYESNILCTLRRKFAIFMEMVNNDTKDVEVKVNSQTQTGISVEIMTNSTEIVSNAYRDSKIGEASVAESTSMPSIFAESDCVKADKSVTRPPELSFTNITASSEVQEQEIKYPIVEALTRIIDDSDGTEGVHKAPALRSQKQRSIYTCSQVCERTQNENLDVSQMESWSPSLEHSPSYLSGRGDGPRCESTPKTKTDSKDRFLTQPVSKPRSTIYSHVPITQSHPPISDLSSATTRTVAEIKEALEDIDQSFKASSRSKSDEKKRDLGIYYATPFTITPKNVPRRKLSVFDRPSDIDDHPSPPSPLQNEKDRRRSSTPIIQDKFGDVKPKSFNSVSALSGGNQYLNAYRNPIECISDSSDSPSPKKNVLNDIESHVKEKLKLKPPVLAPTKTSVLESNAIGSKIPLRKAGSSSLLKPSMLETGRLNEVEKEDIENTQSRDQLFESAITEFSTSLKENDMVLRPNECNKKCKHTKNIVNSKSFTAENNYSKEVKQVQQVVGNGFKDETFTITDKVVAAGDACTPETQGSADYEEHHRGAGCVCGDKENGRPVAHAMSTGEDSSDSECELVASNAEDRSFLSESSNLDAQVDSSSLDTGRTTDDNWGQRRTDIDDKVDQQLSIVNGRDESPDSQKTTPNSIHQESANEDESPRAFPSFSDECLRESGLENLSDIEAEISEHLPEDELKKKYTAFSIGLSTDRMTLTKRMTLSRRQRDQAEKNLNNEVEKMTHDIQDAPRQRNSVSGRVTARRPSLCYEPQKWESEKLSRTNCSSSIGELREIFEQAESRRHSREENNNFVRPTITTNLLTINHEENDVEIWSNTRDDFEPELPTVDNNFTDSRPSQHSSMTGGVLRRCFSWNPTIWGILLAFIVGFFISRVVSSSMRKGPSITWWSCEEILNQYIYVQNHGALRPT